MTYTTLKPASGPRGLWNNIRHIHPGLVLAALDLVGLVIASYLAITELSGRTPVCTVGGYGVSGCADVANSPYSRPFFGIPVAVYGVFLSITLFCLAIYWWRTNKYEILLAHYGLSLVGVLFEGWFQYAQIFLIQAVCIWCEAYGISLILRFIIAFWVFVRTPRPQEDLADESA